MISTFPAAVITASASAWTLFAYDPLQGERRAWVTLLPAASESTQNIITMWSRNAARRALYQGFGAWSPTVAAVGYTGYTATLNWRRNLKTG
eukprot:COSAG06_NODE_5885_length_3229_cov_3.234185_1_plen_92_part_00